MDRHERGWSCLERVSAGGAAGEVRQGRAFRAVPHEGCFCDCCCSNSSALQECVGQSTKLGAGSAGHADTKSCLGSPPLVQSSMAHGSHGERCPPLLWVSGCWKMLLTGPRVLRGLTAACYPPGWCQPSHRADPLPCHPAQERKTNLSAKRHRSVPAGKAAGDPGNAGRHAKGGAPHTRRGVPVRCPAAAGAWRAGITVSTLSGLCSCVSVNPPGVSAKRRLIQLK